MFINLLQLFCFGCTKDVRKKDIHKQDIRKKAIHKQDIRKKDIRKIVWYADPCAIYRGKNDSDLTSKGVLAILKTKIQ